jgi:adenine deaminase
VFDELNTLNAVHVLRNGRSVESASEISEFPPAFLETCEIVTLVANDFEVPAKGPKARVVLISKPRFTEWSEAEVDVESGAVVVPEGATMIAVVNRYSGTSAKPRVGFLHGWGDWDGAFATTISHDSHNLTVFGKDRAEMARAANAVIAAGGGMAVVQQGRVKAVLPLPIAGLVSDAPLNDVASAFARLRDAMEDVVDWEPPYLTFKALVGATLACNAGPHQTDLGIADPQGGVLQTSPVLEDGLD